MSTTKSYSKLTHESFFRLCEWVRCKQEVLIDNAPTLAELASQAAKELQANVRPKALGHAIEITKVIYKPRIALKESTKARRAELDKRLTMLEANVAWLMGGLRELAKELQYTFVSDRIKDVRVLNAQGKK